MNKCRITVCTPTYNRAYAIDELYHSLQRQIFKNFEWLVIDDGSSDQTAELIKQWVSEHNEFPVRYYRKKNGGKHSAVNLGLDLAEGELFFVVDSDDYLTNDALLKIDRWFKDIEFETDIKGIAANKGYKEDQTVNPLFEAAYLDKSLLEMEKYEEKGQKVLSGERALCFYTAFHREYKYPEFEGERFVTEAVAYNRMAHDGYKMRFYNDIIWIYEYRADGLTKAGSSLFLNNPRGYGLWLRERAEFQNESLLSRLKMYYTFTCDLADLQDTKTIAESIGAPHWLIEMIVELRELRDRLLHKR